MRTLLCVLSLVVAGNTVSSASRPFDQAETMWADAVVGVDALGRVLVALDVEPQDGFADHYFLFTAEKRLTPAFSRQMSGAYVVSKDRRLVLLSHDYALSVSLIKDGKTKKREKWDGLENLEKNHPPERFVNKDGIELTRHNDTSASVPLARLSATDSHSGWPDAFYYDLLAPESRTCNDRPCLSGGMCTTGCSISCQLDPKTCSAVCLDSGTFACCWCVPEGNLPPGKNAWSICRCRGCANCNPEGKH